MVSSTIQTGMNKGHNGFRNRYALQALLEKNVSIAENFWQEYTCKQYLEYFLLLLPLFLNLPCVVNIQFG